jgi:hypothetical protein
VEGDLIMYGNHVPAGSPPGILGIAVLAITLVFAVLAVSSLLPRPRGQRRAR